jgi:hydrogenase nickel incorporation protein HypB
VIEGDQQTMNDAKRINATGAPVIQINTGNGCHLDADMISKAVKKLDVAEKSILIIENVGNLVCPSMFDLGESKRVVVISVTEGDDKPIKYPNMFMTSNLCIINKTDLLPYVDFNVEKAKEYAGRVNHHLEFIELSVKTGEGMDKWYEWLRKSNNN